MKKYIPLLFVLLIMSCGGHKKDNRTKNFPKSETQVTQMPNQENVWVFFLAGQSNMAGRGFVEPKDTITSNRILTINKEGQVVYAKEPLHFYEPTMAGLDIGMSFGRTMIKNIPDSISVLLIPTAVGGSSITRWLENEEHRGVHLFSNFQEKMKLGKRLGVVKGILWHQGESDTNSEENIKNYGNNLSILFSKFRNEAEDINLPIVIGELGSYSKNPIGWNSINIEIAKYSKLDPHVKVVSTADLKHKGDEVHFSAQSIRSLGKRYAEKFIDE